jgi:hypothetical protein
MSVPLQFGQRVVRRVAAETGDIIGFSVCAHCKNHDHVAAQNGPQLQRSAASERDPTDKDVIGDSEPLRRPTFVRGGERSDQARTSDNRGRASVRPVIIYCRRPPRFFALATACVSADGARR